ncbi:MAG: hypothetical protein QXW97_00105 [Candidatus Pacearchaeota archaeon]
MNNKILEVLSAIVSLIGLLGGLMIWFFAPRLTGNVTGNTKAISSGALLIIIGLIGSFFWTFYKGKKIKKSKNITNTTKNKNKKRKRKK